MFDANCMNTHCHLNKSAGILNTLKISTSFHDNFRFRNNHQLLDTVREIKAQNMIGEAKANTKKIVRIQWLTCALPAGRRTAKSFDKVKNSAKRQHLKKRHSSPVGVQAIVGCGVTEAFKFTQPGKTWPIKLSKPPAKASYPECDTIIESQAYDNTSHPEPEAVI